MKSFVNFLIKQAKWVSILGTLLACVGAYFSILLYSNLRTEIEELLPTSARSVKDLNEVSSRLRSLDNIVVLIFGEDKVATKRFVLDLAKKLGEVPKETISLVEYRIDKELEFFRKRRALYIDLDDLKTIQNYIKQRIDYEKELYNPLTIFGESKIREPKLDYQALQDKYKNKLAGYDRFPGGFYATPDEKIRSMIVYMSGKGMDKAQRLKEVLEKTVASLKPESYGKIEVKYTGNGQNLLEESAALVEDLAISTIIVMLLVTAAMVTFFRSVPATFALVTSIFMGTFWTFGAAFFTVGYLNANTAFLASIVMGNGINFGIILLARYLEERREGVSHHDAMHTSISSTFGATLTAALGASLSYGSLGMTGFRGFSQFGIIGLVGMVLCWLSAYILLPAYLTLMDAKLDPKWCTVKMGRPIISGTLAKAIGSFPRIIWGASLVGVILSFMALKNYHSEIIETDLTKLRDKRSMESGSGALYHYIDDIFGHSFSPLVIMPKKREQSRAIAAEFRKQKEREGKSSVITSVQTLDDFIPTHQAEKIQTLNEIRHLLPSKLVALLPPAERENIADLLNPSGFVSFTEKDLPPLILSRFEEMDGTTGKIVLVDKQIEKGKDDSVTLGKFVKLGRFLTDQVAPNTPVAGDLPITFDMFEAITIDGPRATLASLLAVVILVILLFRNLKSTLLVLFSLGLGITWLAGIIFGFNLKINFLNFIALPITFGIGVDYGVNIFQRYSQEGPGNILKVIKNTGGAVMLASLTTIIGYGSLLIAGNQAFVSFGRLAVLGELTCMIAAVVSLPAFLSIGRRSHSQHRT